MNFPFLSLKKIGLYALITLFFNSVFAQIIVNLPHVGAKSIKNHSFSNYQQVYHYKIDVALTVDFDEQILKGTVVYHLKRNGLSERSKSAKMAKNIRKTPTILNPELNENKVIFDTKGLVIKSVMGNDGLLNWGYGDSNEILGKALEIDVTEHDTLIQIEYRTLNAKELKQMGSGFISAIQWLNPGQTHDKNNPFMFSQSQAILARTWIPCMDVPEVKFTYNAQVFYPNNLNAVMSAQRFNSLPEFLQKYPLKHGEFQHFRKEIKISGSNAPAKYTVAYFYQSLPISSYLMAIAVGDFKEKRLSENCLVYAEPGLLEKAAWEFVDLPKMIDSASALYGKYAWKEYNVLVLPPSFPFGGMENPVVTFATPTIITGDRSLVSLLAHELAHSWSGNLVTNATWDDFWLNEGFTVYFESRIMEKLYGKDYAQMLAVLGMGELKKTLKDLMETAPSDTRLKLDLKGRNPDDGLTDIAYEKGRFFLVWCEQVMGRKLFDQFLNQYFKKHAFATNKTELFVIELTSFYEKNVKNGKLTKIDFNKNVKSWVYDIGFKEPIIVSAYLTEAESLSAQLNSLDHQNMIFAEESGLKLKNVTRSWTTHHYLHFLRNLDSLSFANMRFLDSIFHFSMTMNSEIAFDWCMLSIKSKYTPTYPFIKEFLNRVGRRKFVLPIYDFLIQEGQKRAQFWMKANNTNSFDMPKIPELKLAFDAYETARDGYHSVTRNSIDGLFQFDEWKK